MFNRSYGVRLFTCTIIFCVLSTIVPATFAQATATLQGTVIDESGAVVANVKITVRNQATGFERIVQTDSVGNYQVAALPVGIYRLEVRADGFQVQIINELTLQVSQIVAQNIQLK